VVNQQFNRIIRNKWIWGAFAIAISAFFAFNFLLTGGDARENRASAGELNGEDVSVSRFNRFAEDARGFGRNRNTALSNAVGNRMAWENIAAYSVAERLGLAETDEEVRQNVLRQFTGQGGAFDMAAYERILRHNTSIILTANMLCLLASGTGLAEDCSEHGGDCLSFIRLHQIFSK
jgi:hypothetical protein